MKPDVGVSMREGPVLALHSDANVTLSTRTQPPIPQVKPLTCPSPEDFRVLQIENLSCLTQDASAPQVSKLSGGNPGWQQERFLRTYLCLASLTWLD